MCIFRSLNMEEDTPNSGGTRSTFFKMTICLLISPPITATIVMIMVLNLIPKVLIPQTHTSSFLPMSGRIFSTHSSLTL